MTGVTFLAWLILAQAIPLIDLVIAPADPGRERPVTNVVGGQSFHHPKPDPKLPLKIDLETIEPSQERPSVKIVQILITNIGNEPFPLPVGRDGDAALNSNNRGRHEFWFGAWASGERYPPLPGAVTFRSSDLPDTVMMIQRGGTVRVRFKLDAGLSRNEWNWGQGKPGILVRARCLDLPYEDNPREYILRHPTPDAKSANELMLTLQ